VFKTRIGQRHARPLIADHLPTDTSQRLSVEVGTGSALFLLPDPVTCFRSARYNQVQTFRIMPDASVVLLDWITSGRMSLGEDWSFHKYFSVNELFVEGRRVARDAMLLEEPQDDIKTLPFRSLADRLSPYTCYATLILYGPHTKRTIEHLSAQFGAIIVFRHSFRPSTLWSFTPIDDNKGCVLRVAAQTTEDVRTWLGEELLHLREFVGEDVYNRTFGR
jgi:urease accessory protein